MLRDSTSMLEAKEAELDEAANYALQLQSQLEELERLRVEAEEAERAGTPVKAETKEQMEAREEEVRALKAERDAAAASAAEEVELLKFQLEERDLALADSISALETREGERARLESEIASRGAEMSPAGGAPVRARRWRRCVRILTATAQLAQVGSELRKAMSAEKKQTERMRRLEMSLSEREEMVRNMDRQLRAAEGAQGAKLAEAQRDEISGKLSERESRLRELEAKMAAHSAESGETENRLADAIEAERVATARAEKLADRVAKEELQRAKLVEDLAAAEDAVELERERAAQLAAEAEEAAAQKESANMERVAELEGRVLQIQMEAEQRVEEGDGARRGKCRRRHARESRRGRARRRSRRARQSQDGARRRARDACGDGRRSEAT